MRLVDARLLGLPLDVHLEASQHSEEMMREFAHLSDGVSDANPPARLITLNRELERRYASFTQATRTELDEATAAGKGTIDLTFRVPEDVGASIVELGDLLEEVDSYCEAGEYLPTLKTPPRSLAYRQWFLGQFLDQLAGNAPVGWSEWVLRRDTSPSPASTGGAD